MYEISTASLTLLLFQEEHFDLTTFISSHAQKYRKSYCSHPGVGINVGVSQMLKFLVDGLS